MLDGGRAQAQFQGVRVCRAWDLDQPIDSTSSEANVPASLLPWKDSDLLVAHDVQGWRGAVDEKAVFSPMR